MGGTAADSAALGKPKMRIETTKKLFTVDEYYRMADAGILTREDRVELIDGEIIEMSPIGVRHAGCVNAATAALTQAFRGKAVVSVQNPLQLTNYTEPEPDVVLLQFRTDSYRGKKQEAADALLVLEVSDTSFAYDSKVKLPLYAEAGIPEVWIENLLEDRLMVYRRPQGNTYRISLSLERTDSISLEAFPDLVFAISELLG
jgi:Uma2 family endonuclease